MDYRYILLASVCFMITVSKENYRTTADEKEFEKNVIQAYRAACERLQDLTDWMSVALETKGLWTRSLSRTGRFLLSHVKKRTKRDAGGEISCASFRNLQKSKETYVLGQVTLIRILADLGGKFMKAGKSRIETSANTLKVLQKPLKDSNLFNDDSGALLQVVRNGPKGLIQQVQKDSEIVAATLKNLGISDSSVKFFQDRKSEILEQLQLAIEAYRSALQPSTNTATVTTAASIQRK